eukprot:TRINITY_DN10814_c0_g2_i1.p1 TRINITY_DN10814_c0_g2~~TRINITY_DN10814_c0_g2_i1.p1  ORF type:complete len:463 (+),score=92.26 TRINITY_DN10814_c0_g2_i1:961-2349(+)
MLRREYEKNGRNSRFLRKFWMIAFVCHLILLFALDTSMMQKRRAMGFEMLAFSHAILLALLNLTSIIYGTDLPNEEMEEEDPFHFRSVQEIRKNRFWSHSIDADTSTSHDMWENFVAADPDHDKVLRSVSREQTPTASFAFDTRDMDPRKEISCVRVVGYEIPKTPKPTPLFVIVYFRFGQRTETKRSFVEFSNLHYELSKEFPQVTFPALPPRRTKKEGADEKLLEERREAFENLLKFIVENEHICPQIHSFLKSQAELPLFERTRKKKFEDDGASKSIEYAGREENPIFTSVVVKPNTKTEETKDDEPKVLSRIGNRAKFSQSIIENYQGDNLNSAFARASQVQTNGVFRVDIDRAFKRGDQMFYEIKIRDFNVNAVYITTKRYSEVKLFHRMLTSEAAKLYQTCPELPYKGNVGLFTSKEDPKVVQYRKMALASYFNYILNNKALQSLDLVKEFLCIPV